MIEQLVARPEPETTTSPEETIESLREQLDILLLAGRAVAAQLKAHGDHQSSFYGHFSDRCQTCVVGSSFAEAAIETEKVIGGLSPQYTIEQE